MPNPFENPAMFTKQAGIGDMLSNAMPVVGGALAGAGSGAGIGGMIGGGTAKGLSAVIGAAMGAYAASKVDSAIDQNQAMGINNAMGIDANGQLGVQNALMNLDQQAALTGQDPYAMGPMGGAGMGPMDGSGYGMGQGIGMPPMGGAGMGQQYGMPAPQAPQVASGQNAMQTMQKKSALQGIDTEARAAVFAYFNQ